MPFVEVFTPAGTLSEERRSQISERLVPEVMVAEGAPDNENARAISWLVWHEGIAWSVGGRPVTAEEPPRYVVRVSVPAASLNDAKRQEIVKRVTQVLADADEDPDRFFSTPASFVLINEIPEGNWGAAGRVFTFTDIAGFILTGIPGQLDDEAVRQAGLGQHALPLEPATTSS